jgi:hypothetical protein
MYESETRSLVGLHPCCGTESEIRDTFSLSGSEFVKARQSRRLRLESVCSSKKNIGIN